MSDTTPCPVSVTLDVLAERASNPANQMNVNGVDVLFVRPGTVVALLRIARTAQEWREGAELPRWDHERSRALMDAALDALPEALRG